MPDSSSGVAALTSNTRFCGESDICVRVQITLRSPSPLAKIIVRWRQGHGRSRESRCETVEVKTAAQRGGDLCHQENHEHLILPGSICHVKTMWHCFDTFDKVIDSFEDAE